MSTPATVSTPTSSTNDGEQRTDDVVQHRALRLRRGFLSSPQAGKSSQSRPGSPTGSATIPPGRRLMILTGRRRVQPPRRYLDLRPFLQAQTPSASSGLRPTYGCGASRRNRRAPARSAPPSRRCDAAGTTSQSPTGRSNGAGTSREVRRLAALSRLDEPPARVAAAQRAADLLLELVQRLHRVPARRPEARDERRRRLPLIALHREGQRRVGVLRRLAARGR